MDNDPGDPLQFKSWIRWTLCLIVGFVTLSVTFASSAYASSVPEITNEMGGSDVIKTLGVCLLLALYSGRFSGLLLLVSILLYSTLYLHYTLYYMLILYSILELFGRQVIFIISSFIHAAFNIGICVAPNMPSILVLRFLSGTSGAVPLTNAGGVMIADCFPPWSEDWP